MVDYFIYFFTLCNDIYGLALCYGWLLVLGLYKDDYLDMFKYVSFLLHSFCDYLGRLRNQFNNTSWVTVVTPTDRPKSSRNRYVIKVLVAFSVVRLLFRDVCGWV